MTQTPPAYVAQAQQYQTYPPAELYQDFAPTTGWYSVPTFVRFAVWVWALGIVLSVVIGIFVGIAVGITAAQN